MQTQTTRYQRQKNTFFPENFLEKRVVNFLGFGNSENSNSNPIAEAQAAELQNKNAKEYYDAQLDQKNSAWNPVHIGSRLTRSAVASVIGRKGETFGKRLGTTALALGTLGFSSLAKTSIDTFTPNAQGIINRTRGGIGHIWQAGKLTAQLPFSLAGSALHAGTSAIGAGANILAATPTAALGAIPGAINLASKPFASWVPGMDWVNQTAKTGQDSMWNKTGNRIQRAGENVSLIGSDLSHSLKNIKGTALDDMKHVAQAGIYAVSPEMLYNSTKEPIEKTTQYLKNSNIFSAIHTPTGKPGESWIKSEKGKTYYEKTKKEFGENNYTPTPYPVNKTDYTPVVQPSETPENHEIADLKTQMEAIQAQLQQVLTQLPANNTPAPTPQTSTPAA